MLPRDSSGCRSRNQAVILALVACAAPYASGCATGEWTLSMTGPGTAGWGSATAMVYTCLGRVLAKDLAVPPGNSTSTHCLPPSAGFAVSVGPSPAPVGISWSLLNASGGVSLSGSGAGLIESCVLLMLPSPHALRLPGWHRHYNNSCPHAYDGFCDNEADSPGGRQTDDGYNRDGFCARGTDAFDCAKVALDANCSTTIANHIATCPPGTSDNDAFALSSVGYDCATLARSGYCWLVGTYCTCSCPQPDNDAGLLAVIVPSRPVLAASLGTAACAAVAARSLCFSLGTDISAICPTSCPWQPPAVASCNAHMVQDSCMWALDGSCDEYATAPSEHTHRCDIGTDTTDCTLVSASTQSAAAADSCSSARDGTCDEPTLCAIGTDTTDCFPVRTVTTVTTNRADEYFWSIENAAGELVCGSMWDLAITNTIEPTVSPSGHLSVTNEPLIEEAGGRYFKDMSEVSEPCYLAPGAYVLKCKDMHGDGWDGGSVNIGSASYCNSGIICTNSWCDTKVVPFTVPATPECIAESVNNTCPAGQFCSNTGHGGFSGGTYDRGPSTCVQKGCNDLAALNTDVAGQPNVFGCQYDCAGLKAALNVGAGSITTCLIYDETSGWPMELSTTRDTTHVLNSCESIQHYRTSNPDSCILAGNGHCEETSYVATLGFTAARAFCADGTDTTDCLNAAAGANNGTCEATCTTWPCPNDVYDAADCVNSCVTANNGICEDQVVDVHGLFNDSHTGCAIGSDHADCCLSQTWIVQGRSNRIPSRFVVGDSTLVLRHGVISGQKAMHNEIACDGTVVGCIAHGYMQQDGMGGAVVATSATVIVENVHMDLNVASRAGGALALLKSTATIRHTQITRCRVAPKTSNGNANIFMGYPEGGYAAHGGAFQGGGGIYAVQSNLTMESVLLSENFASFGGGISLYLADLQGSGLTIEHNVAFETYRDTEDGSSGQGGGIWARLSGLNISNSAVSNNLARYGGADNVLATTMYLIKLSDTVFSPMELTAASRAAAFTKSFAGRSQFSDAASRPEDPTTRETVSLGGAQADCREHPCKLGFRCSYLNYSLNCDQECPVGFVGQDGIVCNRCDAGKGPAPYTAGASACSPCVGNNYSDFGVCQACPSGRTVAAGHKSCVKCPDPTRQEADADGVCRCKAGYFNKSQIDILCWSNDKRDDRADDSLNDATVTSLRETNSSCVTCPACVDCPTQRWKDIKIKPEFGTATPRLTTTDLEAGIVDVFSCPLEGICTGVTLEEVPLGASTTSTAGSANRCQGPDGKAAYDAYDESKDSPLCAVCNDDYVMRGYECRGCGDWSVSSYVMVFILVGLIFIKYLQKVLCGDQFKRHFSLILKIGSIAWPRCRQSFALIVSNYQILCAIPSVTGVRFPEKVQLVLETAKAYVFLDIGHLPGLGCFINTSVYTSFLSKMLTPLCLVMLLWISCKMHIRQLTHSRMPVPPELKPTEVEERDKKKRREQEGKMSNDEKVSFRANMSDVEKKAERKFKKLHVFRICRAVVKERVEKSYYSFIVLIVYLTYPGASGAIFQMWQCRKVGEQSRLIADYSVECWIGKHLTFAYISGFFLVVYTVGIPAFLFAKLRKNKQNIAYKAIFAKTAQTEKLLKEKEQEKALANQKRKILLSSNSTKKDKTKQDKTKEDLAEAAVDHAEAEVQVADADVQIAKARAKSARTAITKYMLDHRDKHSNLMMRVNPDDVDSETIPVGEVQVVSHSNALEPLHQFYRPECAYYEMYFWIEKVVLVGAAGLLTRGSINQWLFNVTVTVCFTLLIAYGMPSKEPRYNIANIMVHCEILCFYIVGLLLNPRLNTTGTSFDTDLITVILIGSQAFVFVWVTGIAVQKALAAVGLARKEVHKDEAADRAVTTKVGIQEKGGGAEPDVAAQSDVDAEKLRKFAFVFKHDYQVWLRGKIGSVSRAENGERVVNNPMAGESDLEST
jgi:hypothetical protein